MNKKYITLIILCLTITPGINIVSAENESVESNKIINSQVNEEDVKDESKRIGENVTTSDNGYLNISFNDSYNGYCINKGWKGASDGDSFTVKNTSAAVNNNNGEEIGNYLKILFVDFHDEVTRDEKLAQNVIWSFSNNYLNHKYTSYVDKIIEIANTGRVIKDHGETININNTTKATFDFEVLSSKGSGYQNFFGYKITYSDIIPEGLLGAVENTTEVESKTNETNTSEIVNETASKENETQRDEANNTMSQDNNTIYYTNTSSENEVELEKDDKKGNNKKVPANNIGLKKHVTSISSVLLILAILIVACITITKYKKD